MKTTTSLFWLVVGTSLGVLLTAAVLDSNYSSPYKEIAWVAAAGVIAVPWLIAKVVYNRRGP